MISEKVVEDRNTTEQCPAQPQKPATMRAPARLQLGYTVVRALPARFLEGTAWDEV